MNENILKVNNVEEYNDFKVTNKYYGKKFSILGDSISTLDGFNPVGYNIFYNKENCFKFGVNCAEDTWWGKVIGFLGGELLVNNSWSGSRVTKLPDSTGLFPSGCSDERTSFLHTGTDLPDVIIIYLGTNDWGNDLYKANCVCRSLFDNAYDFFSDAYNLMLKKIKANYPNSEIWCCSLLSTCISTNPGFVFYRDFDNPLKWYNDIIWENAYRNGCKFINLETFKVPYDTLDGTHPTKSGMDTIARLIIRSVFGVSVDTYLDCADNNHEYIFAEEYTGGTKYVCRKCGKENHISALTHNANFEEHQNTDLDKTTKLYSDILKLYILNSDEEKTFVQDSVKVGRSTNNDLVFNDRYIARIQSMFIYENNMWLLVDCNSTNGTKLNGKRINSNQKYILKENDIIEFAQSQKVIFYKS